MSFSITSREGIQWNDEPISEPTRTFVLTYNAHFVDIRALVSPSDEQEPFPFDWAFYGQVIKPADPNGETTYTHDIDSRYINAIANGSQDADKFLEADCGSSKTLDNGDEAETGTMLNPESMKVEKFLEIWRPLDPTVAPEKIPSHGRGKGGAHCLVLVPSPGQKFTGKLVKVGNWVQAIVKEEGVDGVQSLSIVRAAQPADGTGFSPLISWGSSVNVVPLDYDAFDTSNEVVINGLVWTKLH